MVQETIRLPTTATGRLVEELRKDTSDKSREICFRPPTVTEGPEMWLVSEVGAAACRNTMVTHRGPLGNMHTWPTNQEDPTTNCLMSNWKERSPVLGVVVYKASVFSINLKPRRRSKDRPCQK